MVWVHIIVVTDSINTQNKLRIIRGNPRGGSPWSIKAF